MLLSFDWHHVFPIKLVWTFKNGLDCRYVGFTSFDMQKLIRVYDSRRFFEGENFLNCKIVCPCDLLCL